MNRKQLVLIIGIITIAVALLGYELSSSYFANITVVGIQTEQRNVECSLQWHGRDQTTLELIALADAGRTNDDYTLTVNNGDIFTVPVVANYSWVEISFYGKTLSLHSDGNNATLQKIGYP
jgi:hypothetical protein